MKKSTLVPVAAFVIGFFFCLVAVKSNWVPWLNDYAFLKFEGDAHDRRPLPPLPLAKFWEEKFSALPKDIPFLVLAKPPLKPDLLHHEGVIAKTFQAIAAESLVTHDDVIRLNLTETLFEAEPSLLYLLFEDATRSTLWGKVKPEFPSLNLTQSVVKESFLPDEYFKAYKGGMLEVVGTVESGAGPRSYVRLGFARSDH